MFLKSKKKGLMLSVATAYGFASGGGSSSVIKTIQQRSIVLSAGTASATDTGFTPVTAANAMLIWNGATNDLAASTGYNRAAVRIVLTNGSTVTATRESTTTNAVTVYYTIVEFASGVNSIQYGSATITAAAITQTATISTVGSNAFVIWLGSSTAAVNLNYGDIHTGVTLTNSTTVTANLGAVLTSNITTSFVVVDLGSTIVSSIQQPTPLTSVVASSTDVNSSLTSVTPANTLVFYGGDTIATLNTVSTGAAYTQTLTNATTETFTRVGSGTVGRTHYYTVVSFNPTCLSANAVQRPGTIALAAATSATRGITSVNTAKAFVNWNGFLATSANGNTINPNIVLTNGTTVTSAVPAAGTLTTAFEVIEFA